MSHEHQMDQATLVKTIKSRMPTQWSCTPIGKNSAMIVTNIPYPDDHPVHLYLTPGCAEYVYIASDRGEAIRKSNQVAQGRRIQPPHMVLNDFNLQLRYGAILAGIRQLSDITRVCTKLAHAASRVVAQNLCQ